MRSVPLGKAMFMKTLQLVSLAAVLCLAGCKDGEKPADAQSAGGVQEVPPVAPPPVAVAADDEPASWMGKYSGVLPCWNDCDGLKTELEVRSDSSYTLSSLAMGLENKPNIYNGAYHFDKAKSTVTLDAEGDHLKFLVKDGMLKKLDKFGEPEQGAPQEKYLLRRVK